MQPLLDKFYRVIIVAYLALFAGIAHAVDYSPNTYIPYNAHTYLPLLKYEQGLMWRGLVEPWYLGALIEKESCYTLRSIRCWNPRSQLKTSREEGAGLIQLTRAFNLNGTVRFDMLNTMAKKYSYYLKDLSWSDIYQRPDLQIRAGILLSKENYDALYSITDAKERLYFTDASYNQGIGNTFKQARLCGLVSNCNPRIWFNNVAKMCTGTRVLYGNRSACEINRDHVNDIFNIRMPKYKKLWPDIEPKPFSN